MTAAHDHARKLLRDLAGLSARTDATERKIAEAAEERLVAAKQERDALRPTVLTSERAAADYQALTFEIGHLERVIARKFPGNFQEVLP